MTQHDRRVKWLCYALGVVPVWILETVVLSRLPVMGVIPVLLPLVAVVVGFWEGPVPGGVFGLCLGVVADATYPGSPGGMTLGLCLLGAAAGVITQSGFKQNFLNYFLSAAASMLVLDAIRVLWGAVSGLGSPAVLAPVAVKEVLWSLCFTVPIYLLFKLIHRAVGGDRT